MTWREALTARAYGADLSFADPTTADAIANAEQILGSPLPPPLTQLLLESNGVSGEYGLEVVWPLERIVRDNQRFRTSSDFADVYMSFTSLLFFADAGNGDQFAFRDLRAETGPDVYAWDHEDDSRTWIAADLFSYIDGWLTGAIKL